VSNHEEAAMKTTTRAAIITLTATLLAATTWLSPAAAMPNLKNLLSSGGGTLKLPDVIYPSDYLLQRSLSTSTGLSDVIVRWTDTSPADTSTLIERANSAGVWSTLTMLGPLDGPQSYVDHALPADSEWCYRIRVRGTSAEVLTLPRCVTTQKLNDIGVWRTQLRIRVANVSGGGTDGRVAVSLQGGPFDIPTGSYTGIKTPIDDLEAGSDVTYDLIQDGMPVNFQASVDFAWWEEALVALIDPVCVPATAIAGGPFEECMSQLEKYIAREIKKGFDIPSKRIPVVLPANCVTPAVTVLSDGALYFSCAQARTTTKATTVITGGVTATRLLR
jgi:hypothetical protein